MTSDSSTPEGDAPKIVGRVSVQVLATEAILLQTIAEGAGVSRATVLEYLLNRQPVDELIQEMKANKIRGAPRGRKKKSIFRPDE